MNVDRVDRLVLADLVTGGEPGLQLVVAVAQEEWHPHVRNPRAAKTTLGGRVQAAQITRDIADNLLLGGVVRQHPAFHRLAFVGHRRAARIGRSGRRRASAQKDREQDKRRQNKSEVPLLHGVTLLCKMVKGEFDSPYKRGLSKVDCRWNHGPWPDLRGMSKQRRYYAKWEVYCQAGVGAGAD